MARGWSDATSFHVSASAVARLRWQHPSRRRLGQRFLGAWSKRFRRGDDPTLEIRSSRTCLRSTIIRLILALVVLSVAVQRSAGEASPVAEPPTSEILLERARCLGACPLYRVTLLRDGRTILEGWNPITRIGVYTGPRSPAGFRSVADLFGSAELRDLETRPLGPITELPAVRTTLFLGGSRRVAVRDDDAVCVPSVQGAAVLRELQAGVDTMADGIAWSYAAAKPGVLRPDAL